MDFQDIKGQEHVKRALEVALAGGHHVIMIGPPGYGKTTLAAAAVGILGMVPNATFPVHRVDGQRIPSGIMVKACNGVLILDGIERFTRPALEKIGRVMDEGSETIKGCPQCANTMVIATALPCPCGWHGDPEHTCTCSLALVARHRQHIAAITNRAHIHIEVPPISYERLTSKRLGEPSAHVRDRIQRAWMHQATRGQTTFRANSIMTPEEIRNHCYLDSTSQSLMKAAVRQLALSPGEYNRTLMVSRTVTDLADRENIGPVHIAEAIQYRKRNRE